MATVPSASLSYGGTRRRSCPRSAYPPMLLSTFVLLTALATGPGAVANVNDPLSHGTLGDGLLSLDEAIQVANGTLAIANLSAAEQARIVGTGAVQCITIDAAITPTVTLQSQLTDIIGPGPAVGRLVLQGLDDNGQWPMIDGGTQPVVLSLTRHLLDVNRLQFQGGDVAIDAKMPAMTGTNMVMAVVADCQFDNQVVAGVQMRGTGTDETMLMVRDSSFTNMPLGFRLDDQTSDGRLMSENDRITMNGVTLGCSVFEGGFGNATMWMLWRSRFENGETLAKSTRSPASTQLMMFRIVHSDAYCSGDVVDCTGTANGPTMIHHHHGDWVAGLGRKALFTHPRTAQFDIHGSEMRFEGDVWLSGNTSSPRLWHQNNHYKDCTITFDTDGALPNLLWNRYENCTIDVTAPARSPVVIRKSQLINTSVDSQSFLAPVNVAGCFRQGGAMTGFQSETGPASATFLGTTEVTPSEPQVGTALQLNTDLPFGIALVWDIAVSYARPGTSTEPVRLYGDPATAIVLPAVVLFQSSLSVPIPNNATLAGLEFYAQGIAVPLNNTWAPAFHLPRGSRVLLKP